MDRALYLPESWNEESDCCNQTGIPQQDRGFASKPGLVTALIERAVEPEIVYFHLDNYELSVFPVIETRWTQ